MPTVKIVVYHASYGCETGCCGHIVETDDNQSAFTFSHPYGDDYMEFAKSLILDEFGEEHVKDLDWDNCSISDS